jgi:(1->4)-alpha-D-glucan 1-alpha-D-glucosylmutase
VEHRQRNSPDHTPSSTYRLQLNHLFPFSQAAALIDYLCALGIGDCYCSPFLKSAAGTLHGYDITDHSQINPEIGTLDDLRRWSERLKAHGIGLIADVVPNHMCIEDASNEWWWDVLENGPSSPFARYFDIDWNPLKIGLVNKVLLPILGDQYGRILEDQQIAVIYERGGFFVSVNQKRLPLAPRSWRFLLDPAADRLKNQIGESHPSVLELESILTGLSHLAPADETDVDKIRERQREKEILRKRIGALADSCKEFQGAIEASRLEINGVKGVPHSFDSLEQLLAQQSYRLSFWKVASDEINYRRFFDINQLAAIRVEDPEVFQAVHALMFLLIREGIVDGLRVDHSDGLWDPAEYFRRLQTGCQTARATTRPFYVATEKILLGSETLRSDWDIEGTTGYDFLRSVNGLFVDARGRRPFRRLFEVFTRTHPAAEDLMYECKKLILQTSMSGELSVLAGKLDRISEQHRWSRDFTFASLRHVLRETIACFPIYRTYITGRVDRPDPEDERHIREAINRARRRNQSTEESLFEFLEKLLLLEDPEGTDPAQRMARREFIMSLQQFTGPVMAKGLEDTAFYRYFPLSSLNEVGSDPRQFGTSVAAFHAGNLQRLQSWPRAMLATSTHDSKRSEDVRARLNVLSEISGQWANAIRCWRILNQHNRTNVGEEEAPAPPVEYLFYQTLVGVWPLHKPSASDLAELTNRLQAYMRKALREGKLYSSWINPNRLLEEAVDRFIRSALLSSTDNAFVCQVNAFVDTIKTAGLWNSLSQTLLKISSPGVPDFYQGTEIWDFSLVDPDNRRPVDYVRRRQLLAGIQHIGGTGLQPKIRELSENPTDGAVKLFVTSRALCFRKAHADLMTHGSYLPLRAAGRRQNHVVAFARSLNQRSAIAVSGRFFMSLGAPGRVPVGEQAWGDSVLMLRRDLARTAYRDIFSQTTLEVGARNGQPVLPLAQIFAHLPVALLEPVE